MARYLTQSRTLIQHIPRCGGTFVEKVLEQSDIKYKRWLQKQPDRIPRKHALLEHYHRRDMAGVEYVAAFVRHPVAYYESVYKWVRQAGPFRRHWTWHPHRTVHAIWQPGIDFMDWVFLVLQKEPCWYTRLVESYVGPEGGEFCNFIGRTETLYSDLMLLLRARGHRPSPAVANVGQENAIPDRLAWDEGLRKDVLEAERLVVRRFYGGPKSLARRHYAPVDQASVRRGR